MIRRTVAMLFTSLALAACTSHDVQSLTRGPSLYPVTATLHDEHGATVGVDVFRGHPVVVSMFYGSCPVACPMIVSHVKQIEAELPPATRSDLRVLLVSFDGENDTPAALANIAVARGLDTSRWTLASGSDGDVRQIAAVLGVSYRKMGGGGFAHDSVLTVLDREGRTVARTDDPNPDLAPLRDAVVAVAANR